MLKSRLHIAIWFVFVAITFWLLDSFSISVGDDLGYMFSDTALHKGDGKLITNIGECFSTQWNHYFSTNGRFLVHAATHFFISIAGLETFRIINALMFALLWLYVAKFIGTNHLKLNEFLYLSTLFLLWTLIPDAGTTMLSLVAFAINYMWTAVAYLAFLHILKRITHPKQHVKSDFYIYAALAIFSILVGSLHESYSIPISISLIALWRCRFKTSTPLLTTMIICFFIGTAICVFAPGNFNHITQGGGFDVENIIRKCKFLSEELIFSPITVIFMMISILGVFDIRKSILIIKQNRFCIIVILSSLLLAALTFTSSRQLFCPSIFSIIVIGRMIMSLQHKRPFRLIMASIMTTTVAVIIVFGYLMRQHTYEVYDNLLCQIGSGSTIFADASSSYYNSENAAIRFFAERYVPDPLANQTLHLLFDGYTKRGLSRIGWDNGKSTNLKNILPYPPKIIEKRCTTHHNQYERINDNTLRISSSNLDSRYRAIAVPKEENISNRHLPYESVRAKRVIPYEKFSYEGTIYFILPNDAPQTIILKQQSK